MTQATDFLVVDASVATKWYLTDEVSADIATIFFDEFQAGSIRLAAPEQIRYEVPSAINVASRLSRPRLSEADANAAIRAFLGLRIQMYRHAGLIESAHRLSRRHNCAFYDALYVALAEELAIPFITADNKLYQRVQQLPHVLWIADWRPSR